MEIRDVVSWNLMVDGFAEVGDLDSAWEFFGKIPNPNVVSWVTMLCAFGRRGKLLEARRLFDQMPSKNIASWNAMIGAYVKDFQIEEAARLFREMPKRDSVSWTMMIDGYVHVGQLDNARELLNQMPYKSIVAQTAMLSGYIKNKRMGEACLVFNDIAARDTICWNTMIAGYVQMGRMDKALSLFKDMEKKDLVTWNTMIIGYAQIGEMDKAVKIFEEMKVRNVVSWNSLITGFLQNGLSLDALNSFKLMAHEGTIPDHSTFACGLSACANLAALQVGKQMHNMVLKTGYVNNSFVGNALITMYAKCGRIFYAQLIFNDLHEVDVVSWNSMITGYTLNGHGKEAVQLYEQMVLKGVLPDHVTFIGVLSGCSHIGLVDKGLKLFKCMTEIYSIEPLVEHYACIVDMLGRAGMLYEAFEVVRGLKIKANAGIWGALLSACKIHGNLELGKIASKKLLEFEPHKTSSSVLLSNMQAEAGRWHEVENMRLMMKENEAEKQPGCSWTEVGNQLHCFLSNRPMQPETAEINSTLKALTSQIKNLDRISDDFAYPLDNL
ncbi:Pentatricopeptide repeat - like 10 [Theobroma cacao]|nr:Pentatricopeptide repeat - like 10 [Theobroma cacao]